MTPEPNPYPKGNLPIQGISLFAKKEKPNDLVGVSVVCKNFPGLISHYDTQFKTYYCSRNQRVSTRK